jgi:streptomycin 6-kinase
MIFSETQKEKVIRKWGENIYHRAIGIIDIYKEKWQLDKLELIEHFSTSLLLVCFAEKYGQCVLKIKCDNNSFLESEIRVLRLFNGRGYCCVYEFSFNDKVCLLERILPGDTLYNFNEISQSERINFFCDLYEKLYMPAVEITDLSIVPSYLTCLEESEAETARREDCQDIIRHIKKAKEIILSVNSVYSRKSLIHGDFHHRNILKNQSGGYTAIDPKGLADDPIFDVSKFILYEFGYQLAGKPIEDMLEFIDLLFQRLHIPVEILVKCLYVEITVEVFYRHIATGVSAEQCEGHIWNMTVAEQMMSECSK